MESLVDILIDSSSWFINMDPIAYAASLSDTSLAHTYDTRSFQSTARENSRAVILGDFVGGKSTN